MPDRIFSGFELFPANRKRIHKTVTKSSNVFQRRFHIDSKGKSILVHWLMCSKLCNFVQLFHTDESDFFLGLGPELQIFHFLNSFKCVEIFLLHLPGWLYRACISVRKCNNNGLVLCTDKLLIECKNEQFQAKQFRHTKQPDLPFRLTRDLLPMPKRIFCSI